jgi:hypothetical protein
MAHLAEGIGTLRYRECACVEVHVVPTQTTQLRCPQTGKRGHQQQRAQPVFDSSEQTLDLIRCGDIAADLQLLLVRLLLSTLTAWATRM